MDCASCHREVKDMDRAAWAQKMNGEPKLFHGSCLRHRMSRDTLTEAQQQARDRVSQLMADWRLVFGRWMTLRGYPSREFYDCPVCDGFVPAGSFVPVLKHDIWEVKGVTVSAYHCQVCNYFLPELPEERIDENVSFERQWEVIKSVVGV